MSFIKRPIRRAQLISPFGIGAMVNFPRSESLMPFAIDEWPHAIDKCPADSGWLIEDKRLEARLGVTHFRHPPDFREAGDDVVFAEKQVPMVRFPRWHYCHMCGGMEYLPMNEEKAWRCKGRSMPTRRSCKDIAETRRSRLIPVRFVAVCEAGHIEDFPFMEWCHWQKDGGTVIQANCRLRLLAGGSAASLAGIVIECSCGAKRSLGSAFQFDKNKDRGALASIKCQCQAGQPWLGRMLPEYRGKEALTHSACGRALHVVQRGASNVYFPKVVSSLHLPLWAEKVEPEIIKILDDPSLWDSLSGLTEDGKISLATCKALITLNIQFKGRIDPAKLHAAAQRKLEGQPAAGNAPNPNMTEAEYRVDEYQALCQARGDVNCDLFVTAQNLEAYDCEVGQFFSRIHLVPKLRETRALQGFSRINPAEGGEIQAIKSNLSMDWLPATKVYGEGLFLELDAPRLDEWEQRVLEGRKQHAELFRRYSAVRRKRMQPERPLSPRFLLLHAFAHALINQLSFDCGYGSASLRERLYFQSVSGKPLMHGILIYTASGDSEGSLGGLVRQGKPGRLEVTIRRAIERAAWCSSDPVCLESEGQGPESSNLAACHGCLLLPETSCEEGNRLLDRATLVGTHESPKLGFFGSLN